MTAQSVGASHRSISDRILRKTLAIGLGGSTLLHTAAIAGTSYFYQGNIDDLEITEIERVEVNPVPTPSTKPIASVAKPIPIPSTKPIAPVAKPILAPEPKVTEPIVAAFPAPKPVAIPTPKSVETPAPVVKIVKTTVPVKLPTPPIAKAISPQPNRVAKTVTPVKDKDITNKTDRSQPTTKTRNQSKITNNKPAFGNTSLPSSPLRPSSSNENINDNPTGDGSTPGQPGNGEKLARSNDPAPSGNNQTSLASSNKSLQGLGKQADATESNAPSNEEDFGIGSGSGGLPGNNARIANSRSTIAGGGSSSNQIGLGGIRTNSPNIGDGLRTSGGSADGFSSGGSGDGLGGKGDDFISGAPGNNGRIARGSGIGNGGNGTGGKGNGTGTGTGTNQAGLGGGGGGTGTGGGRRYGSQFGSLDGTGNSNTYSNTTGNDELGNGLTGNIATGSSNKLKIQCLRNCDIKYPENLEDAEIGRDKMLVKITIDANGKVTNVQIDRSSGNSKLDRVALDGVKQMQLTAMGKPLTFRAKISTLANN